MVVYVISSGNGFESDLILTCSRKCCSCLCKATHLTKCRENGVSANKSDFSQTVVSSAVLSHICRCKLIQKTL